MIWPFRKTPEPPDDRPATEAAKAIAASLADEPHRWKIGSKASHLVHDSGVAVESNQNWILQPFIPDEPEANEQVISDGIQAWIVASLTAPQWKKDALPKATPSTEGSTNARP